ncbi:MAG: trigger factor [Oscillospiraceae bacterium]|jgi:trigger factor|nr:trigger factor [Oscillospiraceae bacterium]
MTVKSIEKKEKCLTVLTIEIDAEVFAKACEQAFRKNVGRMNVPGFRKGKAPRGIIEKMYGKEAFYQDAVNATWTEAYDQAVEQEGLEPIERPDVEVETIGAEGYTFIAKVHVYPEIEIGQYKGLSAYYPPAEVTDGEVNAEVDRMRERNASLVTVERAAQTGDTVILDYEGFLDGVPFEGGKGEKQTLELGSGRFIPGFEEKLVGSKAGDEPDIELTFPEEYHAEELAGKPAVFKCKIHEVKEKLLPEADDEFAQDVSEYDTLQAYKDAVRQRILHGKEHESQDAFENALMAQIIPTVTGDIPDVFLARHFEDLINDFSYRLQQRGMNLETYMKITDTNEEAMLAQFRPQAEINAKTSLIFDKIAKLEGLRLDDGEADAEYARLAELFQTSLDEVRERIPEKSLTKDLLSLKASKLITATAVKLDTPPEPPAPPADEQGENPAAEVKPKKKAPAKKKAAKQEEENT